MGDLVFASCWETSRRVLICSETTPTARKAAHASPAPRPNLLVKEEAIQSVESAVVIGVAGLMGFCCWPLTDAVGGSSEDDIPKGGVGGCGCDGGVGGGNGGGGV